jgi:hypothetical protein
MGKHRLVQRVMISFQPKVNNRHRLWVIFKQTLKQTPLVLQVQCNVISKRRNWLYRKKHDASIQTESAWNEFDHQHVFAQYEPRFNQPELLKQDVELMANPRAYLAKIFDGAIDRWIGEQYDHEYHETWLGFQSRVESALSLVSAH